MADQKTGFNVGFSLTSVVFVVFLVLKLIGQAPEWLTWFWVFFPLFIGPAVAILVIGVLAIVLAIIKD